MRLRLFRVAMLHIACVAATAAATTTSTAAAQTAPPCVPRAGHPSVDVSIARSPVDAELTNELAEQTLDEDVRVISGTGFTVGGTIPFGSSLSARFDIARTDLAIVRQPVSGLRDTAAYRDRLGSATLSYATAGVVRSHVINNRLCFETAAGLGAYRLRYADRGTTRPGVSGMIGVHASVSAHAGLLFSLQFHTIFQDGQPPVTSETLFVLRPSAGVRFRF